VSEFDEDVVLSPAEGGYTTEVSARWDIGGRPNGGYSLALVTAALQRTAGLPDPVTITGHYLRPPLAGPAAVGVEVVRRGKGHTTLEGRLVQGDEECVRVLATFGDLSRAAGPSRAAAIPPALPPPEECPPWEELPGHFSERPPFFSRFDLRVARFAPVPDGAGQIEGWIRFADGRQPDVSSLPLFADAFPPAVFAVVSSGWVPTIELTVHVRNRPAPGWLACTFRTRFLIDGYLEEDGEIWDEAGNLVAQSRQLALLPRSP